MKLEIRLIFGIIIQFFVCNGSEFRAHWNKGIKIHVEQGNSYQNVDFAKILGCFQENFQEKALKFKLKPNIEKIYFCSQ
jgi:hypothetical protein